MGLQRAPRAAAPQPGISPQLLFLLILLAGTATAQVPFVSKCPLNYCFLRTYGGFSYYRVRVNPSSFPAGQASLMTDEVLYQTCFSATGQPPPCQGRNSLCDFYSNSLCKAASEEGCQQPMLTTAVQMGCSSPLDPNCEARFLGDTVADREKTGLWASMGGQWGSGESCGRLGTQQHSAVYCSNGKDFSVDGTWWAGCDMQMPTCSSSNPAMGLTLEHYALCVGPTVCTCVHGECDILSSSGYCLQGSCSAGFHGPNCNLLCTSAFCQGRNDPSKPNGGVTVNALNQCVCECLPQYGPGGVEGCSKCILPGSHDCVAYTAEYLASTTALTSAPSGVPVQLAVEARFSSNDQLDPSIETDLLAELSPGGGNGNGQPFTVSPNPFRMKGGRATVRVTFGSACDACVITIRDLDTTNPSLTYRIQALVMPPIQVIANGDRMRAVEAPNGVAPGVPFRITVQVVDSNRNIDRSASNRVRVSLSNSTTGAVLASTPTSSLEQQFSQGTAQWELTVSQLCNACSLIFTDVSVVRTLADYVYGPLQGGGQASRLRVTQPPPQRVNVGESFTVIIDAVDAGGVLDTSVSNTITLTLPRGGGTGNGGVLLSNGGAGVLTAPMSNGRVTFTLSFTDSCSSCLIRAEDASGLATLGSINLSPVTVSSSAKRLHITNTIVSPVRVNEQFIITVAAVDDNNAVDLSDVSRVRLTLMSGGGNSGGGELVLRDNLATRSLLQGNTTAVVMFTRACDACVIKIEDLDGPLMAPTQTPPIEVRTTGTKLGAVGYVPTEVARKVSTEVRIAAIDDYGGIDRSETGSVSMSLVPGGGNGDGGDLTNSFPSVKSRDLAKGEVLYTPTFSQACSKCVLQFVYTNPSYPVLRLDPIKVTTVATRLSFAIAPPTSVAPDEQFTIGVQAVDEAGNRDMRDRGSIRMKSIPGGNNGNGGELLNDLTSSNVPVQTVDGVAIFKPSFTKACAQCRLQFSDPSTTLADLNSEAVVVSGTGLRLAVSDPEWARSTSTSPEGTVAKGATLTITVKVLDKDGAIAQSHVGTIGASLKTNGGNGNGGVMSEVSGAGLTQRVSNGGVTFQLQFNAACSACVVNFVGDAGLTSTRTPPFQVTSARTQLVSDTTTTSVAKGSQILVVVKAVDAAGNVDELFDAKASIRLLPGGTNGGGGTLSSTRATTNFVKGVVTFDFTFSQACDNCYLEVREVVGAMSLTVGPIVVTTTTEAVRALVRGAAGASTLRKDVPFTLDVQAVDLDQNINRQDSGTVHASLLTSDSRPLGSGALQSTLGAIGEQATGVSVSKRLVNGETTLGLVMRQDCASCIVSIAHDRSGVSPATISDGTGAAPSPSTPPSGGGGDSTDALWVVLIVFLVLLLLLCLGLGGYYFWKKKKKSSAQKGPSQKDSFDNAEKDAVQRDSDADAGPNNSLGEDEMMTRPTPRQQPSALRYAYDNSPGRGKSLEGGGYGVDPDMHYSPDAGDPQIHKNPLDAMFNGGGVAPSATRGQPSWMLHDEAQPAGNYPLSPAAPSPFTNAPIPPPTHFQPGEI